MGRQALNLSKAGTCRVWLGHGALFRVRYQYIQFLGLKSSQLSISGPKDVAKSDLWFGVWSSDVATWCASGTVAWRAWLGRDAVLQGVHFAVPLRAR